VLPIQPSPAISALLPLCESAQATLEANQAMSNLLGRSREELWLRSWFHICRPDNERAIGTTNNKEDPPGFPGVWLLQTLRDGKPREQREHRFMSNLRALRPEYSIAKPQQTNPALCLDMSHKIMKGM
jgi:hypothetical protein